LWVNVAMVQSRLISQSIVRQSGHESHGWLFQVLADTEAPPAAAGWHVEVEARPHIATQSSWKSFRVRVGMWKNSIGLL